MFGFRFFYSGRDIQKLKAKQRIFRWNIESKAGPAGYITAAKITALTLQQCKTCNLKKKRPQKVWLIGSKI